MNDASRIARRAALMCGLVAGAAWSGCWSAGKNEVVVYCALDREFAEPVLADFEKQTGVRVLAKYDVESTKTVGLVQEIIQEAPRPRCDLFWNNEILHTLRLEKRGLLDVYVAPGAAGFPANYRSPAGRWHGLAARARVLIVNRDLVPPEQRPTSVQDLLRPEWRGKVGIAKPLFGTTATHAAALFATWGDERAQEFFRQLKLNVEIQSGNKQVATAVGRGQLAFGLTDTDDAIAEVDQGSPVEIVFPDQGADGLGALFIPNTLCIMRGSPHAEHARRLVDYLLSPAVETRLAEGASAQFPVNPKVTAAPRVKPDAPINWMPVDFAAAAEKWETAASWLRDEFDAPPSR